MTRPAHIQAMLDERERTMAEFTADHRSMAIYAIYRTDLEMTAPKMATQVGHAYADAYDWGKLQRPDITSLYRGTGHGTKVLMYAKNEAQLIRAYDDALKLGLPCVLVIDRGDVKLPHFTGKPIITAVGIGPVYKDEAVDITKRYSLAR